MRRVEESAVSVTYLVTEHTSKHDVCEVSTLIDEHTDLWRRDRGQSRNGYDGRLVTTLTQRMPKAQRRRIGKKLPHMPNEIRE